MLSPPFLCTQQRDRPSHRRIRPGHLFPRSHRAQTLQMGGSLDCPSAASHLPHSSAWAPSQGCWPSCCYHENKLVHLHLPFSLPRMFSPPDLPWLTLTSPQISASRVTPSGGGPPRMKLPPIPSPIALMELLILSACGHLLTSASPTRKQAVWGGA